MSRRFIWVCVLVYFLVTLPLVVGFMKSDSIRMIYGEKIMQYKAKVVRPEQVFVGDSITNDGFEQWRPFTFSYFSTDNFSVPGATSIQIEQQVKRALRLQPTRVFIMAGTNDIQFGTIPADLTLATFQKIIKHFSDRGSSLIITLIPFQNEHNYEHIKRLNRRIHKLAKSHLIKTIDLNPLLAPEGVLLKKYTHDGVHFTQAAYDVWLDEINKILN